MPSPHIDLTTVQSSNVEAVGYDAATRTLRVRFKGGKAYDYAAVPAEIYAALTGAASIGSFLATQIKGTYVASPVAPEPVAEAAKRFVKAYVEHIESDGAVRLTINADIVRELEAQPDDCEVHLLLVQRDGKPLVDVLYDRGAAPRPDCEVRMTPR